jgi:hypothetical protein
MMLDLEKSKLYRFPWSLNDNPIGWVEITDLCNIQCKGCYRQRIEGHKSLEEIKEEILFMKRWRNIDNVSLAGGEPLIHPEIVDIVDFIDSQGVKPFILTNGKRLDRELLVELKQAGLAGLSFHIDMQQTRKGWTGKSEMELNELRQYYAEMLWEVGDVPCGFSITVFRQNFNAIPDLIGWALSNKGKVQSFTFITYRGALIEGMEYSVHDQKVSLNFDSLGYVTDDAPEDINIKSPDVYRIIKTHFPEYEASAYLGGTQTHTSFKWLANLTMCCEDQMLGSISPTTMELGQTFHHLLYGTYVVKLRGVRMGKKIFLLAPLDRNIRGALGRLLRKPWRLFKPVYGLGLGIVQAPDVLPDGRVDMCDSCPDMTYFEGRLVNSCRLDEYRKYGELITPTPSEEVVKELAL